MPLGIVYEDPRGVKHYCTWDGRRTRVLNAQLVECEGCRKYYNKYQRECHDYQSLFSSLFDHRHIGLCSPVSILRLLGFPDCLT